MDAAQATATTPDASASPAPDAGTIDVTSPGVPSTFTDDNGKLGYIGLAIIGVTLASLFYSIYWYRKNIAAMEAEMEETDELRKEVSEIKVNLKALLGTRYQSI
jgi:hypothetical protein